MANAFFDSWIVPECILTYVQKDNGVQFKSKLLATMGTMLDMKKVALTAYQSNGTIVPNSHDCGIM